MIQAFTIIGTVIVAGGVAGGVGEYTNNGRSQAVVTAISCGLS